MVTISSAENALKSVYLNVVSDQLNTKSNLLLSRINKTSKDIFGKEIIKLAPYGINGGVCSIIEGNDIILPCSNHYVQFKAQLKNLCGIINISDKAIRASQSNVGAFVNLLDDEMEGLLKASKYNLGRMLYGDGTGLLGVATAFDEQHVSFNDVSNFIEGMKVDYYRNTTFLKALTVLYVDRKNKIVTFDVGFTGVGQPGDLFYARLSRNAEITGIKRLFDTSAENSVLYGVDRANNKWLYSYVEDNSNTATPINDIMIQKALNAIEEESGSQPDFIAASADVRTAYQSYLSTYRRNIDVTTLEGGYKAMTYAGVPIVYERFVPNGTMYLLNSKDFNLHQLCDWEWIQDDKGAILIPSTNRADYRAILVKYAELICDRPTAQGMITNIQSV